MNNTSVWELCPKCYGEGRVPVVGTHMGGTAPTKECPVCKGGLLIHCITGQPRLVLTTNTSA